MPKYVKIILKWKNYTEGSYVVKPEDADLKSLIDSLEPDSENWYAIKTVKMTEKNFEELKEFDGF